MIGVPESRAIAFATPNERSRAEMTSQVEPLLRERSRRAIRYGEFLAQTADLDSA